MPILFVLSPSLCRNAIKWAICSVHMGPCEIKGTGWGHHEKSNHFPLCVMYSLVSDQPSWTWLADQKNVKNGLLCERLKISIFEHTRSVADQFFALKNPEYFCAGVKNNNKNPSDIVKLSGDLINKNKRSTGRYIKERQPTTTMKQMRHQQCVAYKSNN